MYKYLVVFLLLFIFSGCSTSFPDSMGEKDKFFEYEKKFEEEDKIILIALRAEQLHQYRAASNMFNTLYEKHNKKEYLYRSLNNDLSALKYKKVINKIDKIIQGRFDDFTLVRMKIIAQMRENMLEFAKTTAMLLVQESGEVDDYILLSEIYVKLEKYDTALKYLESAYSKDYNEKILDRISIINYVNMDKKKEAIAQLESHSRIHGCSKIICNRLVSFYSDKNDIEGLLSTYLRVYEVEHSERISEKIIQIYGYKKDYVKLMYFLEKSSSDDKLLLQLYIQLKNYKNASLLSDKIYEDTAEIDYLGQSAIFEYESAKDKNDIKMHKRVTDKLKMVIEIDEKALYLNYLGYLLIDHEIDVKLGMQYVDKALQKQPNSAFYLDSKAWGYYKLGECAKAKEIIKRVMKLDGGDEPEVLEHYEKIKKCKKINKINKKGKQ